MTRRTAGGRAGLVPRGWITRSLNFPIEVYIQIGLVLIAALTVAGVAAVSETAYKEEDEYDDEGDGPTSEATAALAPTARICI